MDVSSSIDKNHRPILIIVICASITMLAQTISSSAKVMGYDKVIEADATARVNAILAGVDKHKELVIIRCK